MGSMIHLSVGRLEVDWGKNYGFRDHSPLFQESDVTQVPYLYAGDDVEDDDGNITYVPVIEHKEGLSKPLKLVVDRINLLGHTRAICEQEFYYMSDFNNFDVEKFPYDAFVKSLRAVDVGSLPIDYGEGSEDFGKFFRREIYPRLNFSESDIDLDEVRLSASGAIENFTAYSILQLLADNPTAHDLPVIWSFNDLELGGWAQRDDFVRPLDPSNKFLIVTEGSSDAKFLKKALDLLRPHISDFFYFVDMQEGYPFSGIGNLFNFVKGLISIGVQNNVIVLFDNDAEGRATYEKCAALSVPSNMKILKLPEHPDFTSFLTIGPSGEHTENINGRAVAIECFLDLGETPKVRWNNFNKATQAYQGELIDKEKHARAFLGQRKKTKTYSYEKMEFLLSFLIENCVSIKEVEAAEEYERQFA